MRHTTHHFGLAAVVALVAAVPAGAVPLKLPVVRPHVPIPPVKLPPIPGIRSLPYVPGGLVVYPHPKHHSSSTTLRDALRELRTAQAGVSGTSHPNFTAALGRVESAEHIVARDKHAAAEKKEKQRADSLGSILKSIQDASHHVANHRGPASRDSLDKAAHELESFLNGKKPPAAKKPAKK